MSDASVADHAPGLQAQMPHRTLVRSKQVRKELLLHIQSLLTAVTEVSKGMIETITPATVPTPSAGDAHSTALRSHLDPDPQPRRRSDT